MVTSSAISTRRRAITELPRPMRQRSPMVITGSSSGSRYSPGIPTERLTKAAIRVPEPMAMRDCPNTSPGGKAMALLSPMEWKRPAAASVGAMVPMRSAQCHARWTPAEASRRPQAVRWIVRTTAEIMTAMSDRVSYSVAGGVADVRLNRPDKLNALDGAMVAAILDVGEALAADRSVRAVVLSGEGRGFCAGLDFASFQSMGNADGATAVGNLLAPRDGRIANRAQQMAWLWQELDAAVIAAVHGVALGGGFQIALGADIRIVAPDAKLSVLEVKWGLVPDMTGTQMLPRLVGLDVAKELTFTGRMVSGEEAVRLGMATRVSATPREDALALARELAAKSPDAIAGAKKLLNMAGQASVAEGFAAEATIQGAIIGSPNQTEAVAASFESREAVFVDRG